MDEKEGEGEASSDLKPEVWPLGAEARTRPSMGSLRPVDGPDAGHTVLEAVSPQAGHIIIHYFHLASAESWVLKQVQLMLRAILGVRRQSEPVAATPRTGGLRGGKEATSDDPPPKKWHPALKTLKEGQGNWESGSM